jgi:hypothetical protein
VRRDELYNDNSEGEDESHNGEEDAGIRAKLNERLSRMISLDLEPQIEDEPEPMEEDEPELEFRLFSTSAPKVVVRDDEEAEGDGGIISARPMEFYLKDFSSGEREQIRQVAVDYADIIREAQQRAWGLEVPWRVTKITMKAGKPTSFTLSPQKPQSKNKSKQKLAQDEEPGKRKRPGKKRRIMLRIKEKERLEKERTRKEKEEAMEKQRMTKEEHLKEKKKRLNREKKLKRRQKEKEKKMATKGESGGADGAGDGGGNDDEGSGFDSDESQ